MKRILVTGADGFVGSILCAALLKQGFAVRGAQWQVSPLADGCESVVVGNIGADTDWSAALEGVDSVVHLAARAHVLHETEKDPLFAFRSVNVEGTRNLAAQASLQGIKRFVFISSIGVLGIHTNGRKAFTEADTPIPPEPYGVSKWEAECALLNVAESSPMETVIIRPPLMYGPGVKGNLLSLMKLAATGLPLPLGAVRNQRSLLYVGNLSDFITRCIDHPAAANETFLLSDNCDLTTTELLRRIRLAMGKSPRLIPVPPSWFRLAGRLTGRTAVVDRLFGSLQVDSSKARQLTNWTPPFTIEEGMDAMVRGAGED